MSRIIDTTKIEIEIDGVATLFDFYTEGNAYTGFYFFIFHEGDYREFKYEPHSCRVWKLNLTHSTIVSYPPTLTRLFEWSKSIA